jgi:cysteine desulfurase/selenocysteine lyase
MTAAPNPSLSAALSQDAWDVDRIRADFPILARTVANGKPLVYLDNAATSQKPQAVIDATTEYYTRHNANVHRGVHTLSQEATAIYEGTRDRFARFINARESRELVYTRGATEGINLVASAWARANLKPGDEVLLTEMEHHSNIVPWQLACEVTGATVRVLPVDDAGVLCMEQLDEFLGERTRIVSVVHVSNALGTVNPIRELAARAHAVGALMCVDGAQALQHITVDVQDLGCDFYAFAGHKMFGPTGIGVLYGRAEHLSSMPPYQGGGDMIRSVSFEGTTFNEIPQRFEAGTPNVAGVAGLGAAVDYLTALDADAMHAYEQGLLDHATTRLSEIPGLRIYGTAPGKSAMVSFVLEDIHPHDIGTILDQMGVAIRTGHHCTQPLMDRYGIAATARASMSFYNTTAEIDALVDGLGKVVEMFA